MMKFTAIASTAVLSLSLGAAFAEAEHSTHVWPAGKAAAERRLLGLFDQMQAADPGQANAETASISHYARSILDWLFYSMDTNSATVEPPTLPDMGVDTLLSLPSEIPSIANPGSAGAPNTSIKLQFGSDQKASITQHGAVNGSIVVQSN